MSPDSRSLIPRPRLASPAIRAAGALALGVFVLAAGLWAAGYDAPLALNALWNGAFGSWYAFTSATLLRAVPLILMGFAIAVAFRAGALNIGGEGQFYAGAIAATWVGLHVAVWPAAAAVPAVWLAAMIAGALWIAVPVWLRLRFGVLEVISTLLLNFVAEALVSWMVQGPLQEARHTYPQSDRIADAAQLPLLGGTQLHAGFLLAVALGVALWVGFSRTVFGFQLLAVGTGPRAAETTGRIRSARVLAGALLLSGTLAGLVGGVEVSGVSHALFQNLSPGYGFTGIAVALLAELNPLGIIVSGVLFGALEAGAAAMQREAGIPAVLVYVVEAVIIIAVLLANELTRRAHERRVIAEAPAHG